MTIFADSEDGSGIGSGSVDDGTALIWTLQIADGHIEATSRQGAGIGTGAADERGQTEVDSIVIANGVIRAATSAGSGIGPGFEGNGTARVSEVVIKSGWIVAEGEIAIGAETMASIQLSATDNFVSLDLYATVEYALTAMLILCHEGTVWAVTNTRHFFDPRKTTNLGELDFMGEYRDLSQVESLSGNQPCLHIARLPTFEFFATLQIRHLGSSYSKMLSLDGYPQLGFIVTLRDVGIYEIDVASEPGHALAHDGLLFFDVKPGDNFFEHAVVVDTSGTPTDDDSPLSIGAVIAISVSVILLCVFALIVAIVNRRHLGRKAPAPRPDAPAPETLISATGTQGLLDEGSELAELPLPLDTVGLPAKFREEPELDSPAPEFPVDPSFAPEFADDM
jgi:hypothetical protein